MTDEQAILQQVTRERDRARAEAAELRKNGVPGVMHAVDKEFYDLVVKERDYARVQVQHRNSEIARLRAELDQRLQRNVVLFYERPNLTTREAVMEMFRLTYAEEPAGTIARATDTGREWVKMATGWDEVPDA